ncbi:hypothetical protein IFM89_007109 [Coptis chinensis]|uniref:Uncharacterized protein n=1 Tax=Coptis chinensis TaxID=261450 RepID=A0A835H2G6_9MAGN|nr:hypothetical protein IFM89_007109 [Coptis chinensis]
MDTHYSPGGSNSLDDDQLNEDMGDDATNIPSSSRVASSKKRPFNWHRRKLRVNHAPNLSCLHLLARTSVAIARNELALEKGILNRRLQGQTPICLFINQRKLFHKAEVLNSIKNHISEHPESQYDLSGDAIATGDSLMKKNDGLMEANTLLERRIETIEANMDAKMSRHMEEVRGLFMSQRGTFNDNVPSPHSHASRHSTAPKIVLIKTPVNKFGLQEHHCYRPS